MERPSIDFDDMIAFLRVMETGSFARAGERLGISKSIVSRRVSRLEELLGTKLLTRNARGAIPTLIGTEYHQRISTIFNELEAANEAVGCAVSEIAGAIRLTAPVSFGVDHLAPVLAAFAQAHPRIELDVILEDRHIDLLAEHFDLAVRIGSLPDSSLIARRIAPIRTVVAASPAYLDARGRPKHPQDLTDHAVLSYSNVAPGAEWKFEIDGRWQRIRAASRIRVNNGDVLREMSCAGLGIAMLPSFLVSDALAEGRLEVVLPEWRLAEHGLYAVMPPGRAAIARVRALVDHLAAALGPEPRWDPCWRAAQARRT